MLYLRACSLRYVRIYTVRVAEERQMSIGEVVKRTSLTERTLRFYEELGLIYPGRTEGGRRIYGTVDLTTLHHVTLLKRAGFSLSHIKQLLDAPSFGGEEIVEVQIASLQLERSVIDHALACLASARKAIALGASLDAVSLCNLIQLGERNMQNDVWKEFYDNHYTPEEQELWKNVKLAAAGGDIEGYIQKWEDLMQRIEQALPLDPASEAAQGYLAEWKSLLVPFANSLDDDMTAEAAAFPGKVTDQSMEPLVKEELLEFIKAAESASVKK